MRQDLICKLCKFCGVNGLYQISQKNYPLFGAKIFVRGLYLFQDVNSLLGAKLALVKQANLYDGS